MRTGPFTQGARAAVLAAGLVASGPARADLSASPHPSPPITSELADPPLWGDKDGLVYLRDPADLIRLYPHAQLDLDAHGFLGHGTPTLSPGEAGVDLGPRFFVRHSRFELGGEIFKRMAFDVSLDLVANPAIDGAMADGRKTRVALVDAWGSIEAGRGLSLRLGVFQAPFSLENTTAVRDLATMERNLATRFVVPAQKVLGAAASLVTNRNVWRIDWGVFGAESLDPGRFERSFDTIARVSIHPLRSGALDDFQLGVSGRFGARNSRDTNADLGAITSGLGFALWRPTRTTADGNTLHVKPSTEQAAVGAELRLPFSGFVLRSELTWVYRNTRETSSGVDEFPSKRGRLDGFGWYAELSCWPLQLAGVVESAMPVFGNLPRNEHLELASLSVPSERYGLELALLLAGVNARYRSAVRAGVPETPPPGERIDVAQLTFSVNFWHTKRFKLSLNLSDYWAKGSGSSDNLAVVPANLGPPAQRSDAHSVYEIGARTMLAF